MGARRRGPDHRRRAGEVPRGARGARSSRRRRRRDARGAQREPGRRAARARRPRRRATGVVRSGRGSRRRDPGAPRGPRDHGGRVRSSRRRGHPGRRSSPGPGCASSRRPAVRPTASVPSCAGTDLAAGHSSRERSTTHDVDTRCGGAARPGRGRRRCDPRRRPRHRRRARRGGRHRDLHRPHDAHGARVGVRPAGDDRGDRRPGHVARRPRHRRRRRPPRPRAGAGPRRPRSRAEHGHVDVLVNDIWGGELLKGGPRAVEHADLGARPRRRSAHPAPGDRDAPRHVALPAAAARRPAGRARWSRSPTAPRATTRRTTASRCTTTWPRSR